MFKRKPKSSKKPVAQTPARQVNPNDTISAVSKLKSTQGNLEKRVNFLRKKAQAQLNKAKEANRNGKKDEALHNLKRKKILEKEIKTLESSILTIEEQVLRIEGGAAVSDVYEALQLANSTLKAVNTKVDPDKLAELMNDIEDMNADMDEANDILNGANDLTDDAELLEEFENLDGEQLEEEAFAGLATVPKTAAENKEDRELLKQLRQDSADLRELQGLMVPSNVPQIRKPVAEDEEDELAALEAQMLA